MLACAALTSEALGILDQNVAHAVDAFEQAEIDAVDVSDRRQPSIGVPDEGVRARQRIGTRGFWGSGGQPGRDGLQRARDSFLHLMIGRRRWTFCRGLERFRRGGLCSRARAGFSRLF
jgi:hypothetical protein